MSEVVVGDGVGGGGDAGDIFVVVIYDVIAGL